jgi:hypothetical protein
MFEEYIMSSSNSLRSRGEASSGFLVRLSREKARSQEAMWISFHSLPASENLKVRNVRTQAKPPITLLLVLALVLALLLSGNNLALPVATKETHRNHP